MCLARRLWPRLISILVRPPIRPSSAHHPRRSMETAPITAVTSRFRCGTAPAIPCPMAPLSSCPPLLALPSHPRTDVLLLWVARFLGALHPSMALQFPYLL